MQNKSSVKSGILREMQTFHLAFQHADSKLEPEASAAVYGNVHLAEKS